MVYISYFSNYLYGLYFIYTGYSRAVSLVFPMRFPWCIADMYPQSSAPLPFQPSSSIINIQLYIYSYYYSSHSHPSSLPLSSTFSLPLIFIYYPPSILRLIFHLPSYSPHIPSHNSLTFPFLFLSNPTFYYSFPFLILSHSPSYTYLISFLISIPPLLPILIPIYIYISSPLLLPISFPFLFLSHLPFYYLSHSLS